MKTVYLIGCTYKDPEHMKRGDFQSIVLLTKKWKRCTDACSWSGLGELGPQIPGTQTVTEFFNGFSTGRHISVPALTSFRKRRYERID